MRSLGDNLNHMEFLLELLRQGEALHHPRLRPRGGHATFLKREAAGEDPGAGAGAQEEGDAPPNPPSHWARLANQEGRYSPLSFLAGRG